MSTDDLLFGDAFKASPDEALAALTSKYGKLVPQAGEATTETRTRRTRRRSSAADTTQMDTSPAAHPGESVPTQDTSATGPAVSEQTASGNSTPTPEMTQAGQPRRTSASIPADVWHAVAHYCVTNSVSRIGLIMRALAKTNGQHKELVDRERSRDTTSSEDKAAMEMFGLTEAPIRRGGAQPKKQMPYVVTQSVADTIDRLVVESGAHNRGELFTAVLRSYLGVE